MYAATSSGQHTLAFRIYYEDTDAAGIVYHANYLKFAERARTEWLRELDFSQQALREEVGLGFVVRRIEIDYLASAKLDDEITVQTRLQETGKVRMTMTQKILLGDKELAVLTVLLVCVNNQGKPTALPTALMKKLSPSADIT